MENIVIYKNRELDLSKKVRLFRNLTRKGKVYSIQQSGRTVAHTESFVVANPKFIVNEKGRQQVIKNKHKVVHAYVEGYLADTSAIRMTFSFGLSYNPYENEKFCITRGDHKSYIEEAEVVYTQDGRLLVQI